MQHKSNRVRSEIDAKNRVSVMPYHILWQDIIQKIEFSYGELNVVLAIQLSYRRIKLR